MLKHIKLYFSFKEYFEETPEIKIVQSCKNIDIKDGGDAGGVGEVVLVGSRVRLCSLGSPCHGASLSCDQIASERKPEGRRESDMEGEAGDVTWSVGSSLKVPGGFVIT